MVSISASEASTTRIRPLVDWSTGGPEGAPAGSLISSIVPARPSTDSVSVLLRLVRTRDVDAEVLRLDVGQGRQLHAERVEVEAGALLVEVLGQHVDAD